MKKKKIILSIILGIVLATMVCGGFLFYEFAKAFKEHNEAMKPPTPGTQAWEDYLEMLERTEIEGEEIRKASNYRKEGKYELAIKVYLKGIKKNMIDEGRARYGLMECYEKTGRYDLAIQQVDWFIARKPGEYAMNVLLQDKARLQNLLQEQK